MTTLTLPQPPLTIRHAPRRAPAPLDEPLRTVIGTDHDAPPPQDVLDLDFGTALDEPGEIRRSATSRGGAPEAHANAVVQAVLEVLDGQRSPVVLQRLVTPDVLALLVRRASAARANNAARTRSTQRQRPRVIRMRLAVEDLRACEGAAVVHCGGRIRAVAFRFVRTHDRWVLDILDIG